MTRANVDIEREALLRELQAQADRRYEKWWGRFLWWLLRKTT